MNCTDRRFRGLDGNIVVLVLEPFWRVVSHRAKPCLKNLDLPIFDKELLASGLELIFQVKDLSVLFQQIIWMSGGRSGGSVSFFVPPKEVSGRLWFRDGDKGTHYIFLRFSAACLESVRPVRPADGVVCLHTMFDIGDTNTFDYGVYGTGNVSVHVRVSGNEVGREIDLRMDVLGDDTTGKPAFGLIMRNIHHDSERSDGAIMERSLPV